MERGRAQRLEPVRVHDLDLRLVLARDLALLPAGGLDLRKKQVLVGVASENEQLELLPQLFGGQRKVPDLPALGVDAHAPTTEVEVLEAELGERSFADADQEEELERDAVAELGLRSDDPVHDVAIEQWTLDVAQPRAADRDDGVALELELALRPPEERHENRAHLL